MKDDFNAPFILTKMSGISNVEYDHASIGFEKTHIAGGGKDIAILLAVKHTHDYYSVRRIVSKALPIDSDVNLEVFVDDLSYATITCRVRGLSFDFSEQTPSISIDLTSVYTCLTSSNEVGVYSLPFGVNAQIDKDTHDYTPVFVEIFLVSPMASWYKIQISSDWLTIHTSILRTNYGINGVPVGSKIVINSDISDFYIKLLRPGYQDVNIETACNVGEFGFNFIPNEDMIVKTQKLPSSFSGEYINLTCRPKISGV